MDTKKHSKLVITFISSMYLFFLTCIIIYISLYKLCRESHLEGACVMSWFTYPITLFWIVTVFVRNNLKYYTSFILSPVYTIGTTMLSFDTVRDDCFSQNEILLGKVCDILNKLNLFILILIIIVSAFILLKNKKFSSNSLSRIRLTNQVLLMVSYLSITPVLYGSLWLSSHSSEYTSVMLVFLLVLCLLIISFKNNRWIHYINLVACPVLIVYFLRLVFNADDTAYYTSAEILFANICSILNIINILLLITMFTLSLIIIHKSKD